MLLCAVCSGVNYDEIEFIGSHADCVTNMKTGRNYKRTIKEYITLRKVNDYVGGMAELGMFMSFVL